MSYNTDIQREDEKVGSRGSCHKNNILVIGQSFFFFNVFPSYMCREYVYGR